MTPLPAAELGGHLKGRIGVEQYPAHSLFRDVLGDSARDQGADLRLRFGERAGRWSFEAHYQLQARQGDGVELQNRLPLSGLLPDSAPNDERRLMRLTHVISEGRRDLRLHRLDRLSIGWQNPRWVARVGRQAISWGNGLFYAPMDIFNPFDPAAIDKEYKSGDDLFYGQWLSDGGADLQLVWVVRRDPLSQSVDPEQASQALKYHGFFSLGRDEDEGEFDLLLARHYDDPLLGLGLLHNLGEGIWRGDFTLTRSDHRTVASLVSSLSWSWVGWNKNMSGALEYYYNGFGERAGTPGLEAVVDNRELLERLVRGELYALGRHYLAASLTLEATPLLRLTPTLFTGLQGPSALAQLRLEYDMTQSMRVLAALEQPIGPRGTEFSGIEASALAPLPRRYLSRQSRLTLQLGWYF
ncbi:hypothetical protein D0544_13150 [Aestuariirhabdus litorea]|uniref:Alginate export domain-containing protein n=1 Tax=Aestuariirhabdus litorea TaxID=2528527 RepID=A0A3P3VJ91_9GAMM|nr:hypothetical protein D0544_13150 [Aestuariirhabdus litorea]